MKKAIELLKTARAFAACGGSYSIIVGQIDKALAELKAPPRWETPEQREKRTGEAWPENGAVRVLLPNNDWDLMEYWRAEQLRQDLARLDKDFGDEPRGLIIMCDRGESGPPPDDWRPEED
jgi:hypothetical protein